MNENDFVEVYKDKYRDYEKFTKKLKELIEQILYAKELDGVVEGRTKDVESYKEKINRPGKSYTDPINEITDLSGVRVILKSLSDVKKIKGYIRQEFLVDDNNSLDKSISHDIDTFGYLSSHYIVVLDHTRVNLPEWSLFRGFRAEIQIRTLLQHAWAGISHSLEYKNQKDIPMKFRRKLYRLCALFEIADDEIDTLFDSIEENKKALSMELERGNQEIEINVDSVKAFVNTSTDIKYWNDFLFEGTGQNIDGWGDLSRDVRLMEFCGIKTISNITDILVYSRGWGEAFLKEYMELFYRYVAHIDKRDGGTAKNGTLIMLVIANNIDKLNTMILEKDFGWGQAGFLLQAAKNHNPRSKET